MSLFGKRSLFFWTQKNRLLLFVVKGRRGATGTPARSVIVVCASCAFFNAAKGREKKAIAVFPRFPFDSLPAVCAGGEASRRAFRPPAVFHDEQKESDFPCPENRTPFAKLIRPRPAKRREGAGSHSLQGVTPCQRGEARPVRCRKPSGQVIGRSRRGAQCFQCAGSRACGEWPR